MHGEIYVIATLISLGALVAVVYGPWQEYCITSARQDIFEARAALFNLATNGKLDFGSSEYREIRLGLETLIRFAHKISWLRLLFVRPLARKINPGLNTSFLDVVNEIQDAELRREVNTIAMKAVRAVVWLLFKRSPIFLVLSVLPLIARAVNFQVKRVVYHVALVIYYAIELDARSDPDTAVISVNDSNRFAA